MVIDNTDAGASQTGTWYNNTYAGGGGYIGSNYVANNTGTGANVFVWTPTLASAGRWRAYARWIQFTNHATDAKYRVFHAGGETVVAVDQQRDGGRWIALGGFDLAPGSSHRIELKDDGNGYVIADAVRFVRLADSKFVAADAVKFVKNDAEALVYVHADHLGRPQKMTNTARQVVWDAQYRPFGEEHAIAGAGFNDERFPGQLWDDETGLHYNYFRDYDPKIGRYLQSDPIGLAGGLNTYGYVSGNPVNAIDPTGEIGPAAIVIPIVGAGAGAAGRFIAGRYIFGYSARMLRLCATQPRQCVKSIIGFIPARWLPRVLPPLIPLPLPSSSHRDGGTGSGDTKTQDGESSSDADAETAESPEVTDPPGPAAADTETGQSPDREPTPTTHPEDFGPIKGKKGKINKGTGEVWERDMLHKDHYEVYKDRRRYEKGVPYRDVWSDGRPKSTF